MQQARIGALIEEVIPAVARDLDAAIVDGGSDAGVMRAVGRAWRATRCPQPLVGVMARGTIAMDGAAARHAGSSTAPPEPNHTHLVVVPGGRWGDERPWLLAVAAALSAGRPRAMLLVNGGPLARREALEAAADGVPVLVLRGSGRVADNSRTRSTGGSRWPVRTASTWGSGSGPFPGSRRPCEKRCGRPWVPSTRREPVIRRRCRAADPFSRAAIGHNHAISSARTA